jgi:hypothetical protein
MRIQTRRGAKAKQAQASKASKRRRGGAGTSNAGTVLTDEPPPPAKDIDEVAASMDFEFYSTQVELPGVKEWLAKHFCEVGWRAGHDPVPWFSVTRYLHHYEDVRVSGTNPFLHYLRQGRSKGYRAYTSLLIVERPTEILALDLEFDDLMSIFI